MELQPIRSEAWNVFTAYGKDYVDLNSVRHGLGIIVLPDRVIKAWTAADVESLTLADFEFLAALDAEIILLGMGARFRFPRPELLQPFACIHKEFEAMDTHTACRTYNILVSEGRRVAVALLPR